MTKQTGTKGRKRQSVWTDELIERMLALWQQGLSASNIAKELCAMAGKELSRNAVIGKLHRMRKAGLIPEREEKPGRAQQRPASARKARTERQEARPQPQRGTAGSLALETRPQPVATPQARPQPQLEVVAEEKGLVSDIMDLGPHSCRWPIGNPGEEGFSFCGHRSQEGKPYCERHAAVAYQN